jgi:hypothetical protein
LFRIIMFVIYDPQNKTARVIIRSSVFFENMLPTSQICGGHIVISDCKPWASGDMFDINLDREKDSSNS